MWQGPAWSNVCNFYELFVKQALTRYCFSKPSLLTPDFCPSDFCPVQTSKNFILTSLKNEIFLIYTRELFWDCFLPHLLVSGSFFPFPSSFGVQHFFLFLQSRHWDLGNVVKLLTTGLINASKACSLGSSTSNTTSFQGNILIYI